MPSSLIPADASAPLDIDFHFVDPSGNGDFVEILTGGITSPHPGFDAIVPYGP